MKNKKLLISILACMLTLSACGTSTTSSKVDLNSMSIDEIVENAKKMKKLNQLVCQILGQIGKTHGKA